MSKNKGAYTRYLKSLVRTSVNLEKLKDIPVSPKWVLELTDTILREKQNQYLDKNNEPPPEMVTGIAKSLLTEFREIKSTLKTGEVSNPVIPKLLKNNQDRAMREERSFNKRVKTLVDKGIPREAAEETLKESKTKKVAPVAKIVPKTESGEIAISGAKYVFKDIISDEIVLTPEGVGFWQAYQVVQPFIDERKEQGNPYDNFIIKLSNGTEISISGEKGGSLKKEINNIISKMNDHGREAKKEDGKGKVKYTIDSGMSAVVSESGNDLIISIDVPEDFEY